MTELTRQDQIRLAPLRAAIRGWQFASNLTPYARAGEKELRLLPSRLLPHGERVISPLRAEITKRQYRQE